MPGQTLQTSVRENLRIHGSTLIHADAWRQEKRKKSLAKFRKEPGGAALMTAEPARRERVNGNPNIKKSTMPKKAPINPEQQMADLTRLLRETQEKQKVSAQIRKWDLPADKTKVYRLLEKLAALNVAEDYKATLLHLVSACGDAGARLPLIRKTMPDQVALDDARKEIGTGKFNFVDAGKTIEKEGAGHLQEKTDGNSITIFITEAGKEAFEKLKAESAESPQQT